MIAVVSTYNRVLIMHHCTSLFGTETYIESHIAIPTTMRRSVVAACLALLDTDLYTYGLAPDSIMNECAMNVCGGSAD